jgi:hypothetical protein
MRTLTLVPPVRTPAALTDRCIKIFTLNEYA